MQYFTISCVQSNFSLIIINKQLVDTHPTNFRDLCVIGFSINICMCIVDHDIIILYIYEWFKTNDIRMPFICIAVVYTIKIASSYHWRCNYSRAHTPLNIYLVFEQIIQNTLSLTIWIYLFHEQLINLVQWTCMHFHLLLAMTDSVFKLQWLFTCFEHLTIE